MKQYFIMKKIIMMLLVLAGGISTASAWGDLYLICAENNSWSKGADNGSNDNYKNDAFKFTWLAENSYRATIPGSYIQNGDWYFRFRDASSDTWKSISPESTEENAEITETAYSTNWQNSDIKAFYIKQNPSAKYVHIFCNWNNSTSKWDITCSFVTEPTEYTVAFTNPLSWAPSDVKVYAFLDGVRLAGDWPGTVMTYENNIYTAKITGAPNSRIIFSNNGSSQSWTFDVEDNKIYNIDEKVESVRVSAGNGIATFSSAYPLDFSSAQNIITAYSISSLTETAATLTKVDFPVEAQTGLIIIGAANASNDIPTAITTTSIAETNKLKAAVTSKYVSKDEAYILSSGKFVKSEPGNIPAGKAYLPIPNPTEARSLSLVFGDEATGIQSIDKAANENVFYNLAGQRVTAPANGLFIMNGKKIIVK